MRLPKLILLIGFLSLIITFHLSSIATANGNTNVPFKNLNIKQMAFSIALVDAALERLNHKVIYDGSYREIAFPGGDVPNHIGVCTDVVVRAYRKLGIDLQEQVHQDMLNSFHHYPNLPKWERIRPDTNIDHRRVLNLRVFFERQGASLPITFDSNDYLPGDLVTWDIRPGMPHIGIVTDNISNDKTRPLIVHNIGKGPKLIIETCRKSFKPIKLTL